MPPSVGIKGRFGVMFWSWSGKAELGVARQGGRGGARSGLAGRGQAVMERRGASRLGEARPGGRVLESPGMVRSGTKGHGMAVAVRLGRSGRDSSGRSLRAELRHFLIGERFPSLLHNRGLRPRI